MSSYRSPTRFFHFSASPGLLTPSSSTRISSSSPRAFSSATTLRPINPAAPVTIIGSAIYPRPLTNSNYRSGAVYLTLQQLPRNHHPLNLARPLANRAQLHIAIKLLRRIVLDEAISTMNLHAFLA